MDWSTVPVYFMLLLNSQDIASCFSMQDAVDVQREVFEALGRGQVEQPQRLQLDVNDRGTTLVMPAVVQARETAVAVKVVSVFPANEHLPPILGAVLVLDAGTGEPTAMLDGTSITAMRTAAASAVATDLLARDSSSELAVFGAGTQARSHIRAIRSVRDITGLRIYSRTPARAELLALETCCEGLNVRVAGSPKDALAGAHIVCTTTTSDESVFDGREIEPGTHVNAVGAYKPTSRELPANLLGKARVFVDSVHEAFEEAGDVLLAIEEGVMNKSDIVGDLGQLLVKNIKGRTGEEEITVFKSVGMAAQDALTSARCIAAARAAGVGIEFDLS